ncbi:MAG: 50S ribosomal protein L23 [Candidatus Paceibacterota bacterium]
MALFSRKEKAEKEQNETKEVAKVENKKSTTNKSNLGHDLSRIISGVRITEKSVNQGDKNVYTFNVRRDATKFQVRDAIKALYSVTPVKVNIVNKKPALRLAGSKNRMVKEPGAKKAYVYLKKGDTINLV